MLRRGQMLLASARGTRAPPLAGQLGGDDQRGLDVVPAFTAHDRDALHQGASRPHRPPPPAFPGAQAEQVRALRPRHPRAGGQQTRRWTRALAAAGSCAPGVTARLVTGAALRQTRRRRGIGWQCATPWITRPDPEEVRPPGNATG